MDVVVGVLLLLVGLVALALAGVALRRRALSRRGGVFGCSLRERPAPQGRGWMLGLARYAEDTLEWYRLFSLSPRPRRAIPRRGLSVLSPREPVGEECYALLPGAVVVECRRGGSSVELGMGTDALTGFLSWLEASPPGRDVNVA